MERPGLKHCVNTMEFTYNPFADDLAPLTYGHTVPLAPEDEPKLLDPWASWNNWLCPLQLQDPTASYLWLDSDIVLK